MSAQKITAGDGGHRPAAAKQTTLSEPDSSIALRLGTCLICSKRIEPSSATLHHCPNCRAWWRWFRANRRVMAEVPR